MPDECSQLNWMVKLAITLAGGLVGGAASFLIVWMSRFFFGTEFIMIIPAGIMGVVFGSFPGVLIQAALVAQQKRSTPLSKGALFLSSFLPGFFFSGIVIIALETGKSV